MPDLAGGQQAAAAPAIVPGDTAAGGLRRRRDAGILPGVSTIPGPSEAPSSGPFVDQPRGFDLLALPGLRRLLRWRYARFAFQLPLLILALLVIVDGLTGTQMAARNVATTGVWIHYRGLVALWERLLRCLPAHAHAGSRVG